MQIKFSMHSSLTQMQSDVALEPMPPQTLFSKQQELPVYIHTFPYLLSPIRSSWIVQAAHAKLQPPVISLFKLGLTQFAQLGNTGFEVASDVCSFPLSLKPLIRHLSISEVIQHIPSTHFIWAISQKAKMTHCFFPLEQSAVSPQSNDSASVMVLITSGPQRRKTSPRWIHSSESLTIIP